MYNYREENAVDFLFTDTIPAVNVVNLGYLARYIRSVHNPDNTFYMNGSMGLCLAFSIGIAMESTKKVNCIVGDGAFIMNLQSLVMLRSCDNSLSNLTIYLIDNHCHNSTGAQPSFSEKINFKALCAAFDLAYFSVSNDKQFEEASFRKEGVHGPSLVHVSVDRIKKAPARMAEHPVEIKSNFLKHGITWIR